MENNCQSHPLSLREIQIQDGFWTKEMELVRREVIPYQWEALNDRVPGAAPSYCMHNFKTAVKKNALRKSQGSAFREPSFSKNGWFFQPKDPQHPDEDFYGFVFQDSDFYKWIEAVGYSLTQHPDPQLEAIADEAIEIVCSAQLENGYLDTLYILGGTDKIFTNLRDHHELYCLGHLIEGAVAYYDATGKDRLLRTACRYADFVCETFGPEEGKCHGYPGHEIAEMALMRLYEVTGEDRYLKLAEFFLDARGTRPYYFDREHPENGTARPDELRHFYHQAHLPVRQQEGAVGHAVRAVYLYSGMASVAKQTGDPALLAACERLWNDIVQKKMYITGGIGSTHLGEAFTFAYDLPNDTAYAETCASIGLMFFARRMLEMTPKACYADEMERALYNTVLSGMALDGKSFFYVNPLEVDPEATKKDERKFHVKSVRQKWFGCACCPPNLARLISSIGSYAYTENDSTLFVHLYVGGQITKQTGPRSFSGIVIRSGFPHDGNVSITFPEDTPSFTLALRLPGWCSSYTVTGTKGAVLQEKEGYLYLTKAFSKNDEINLSFPMEPRLVKCNPLVRENVGKVALTRGPVVYCLESVDNGSNLPLLSVDSTADARTEEITIAGEAVPSLVIPGFREISSAQGQLYVPYTPPKRESVALRFIPYYTWANRGENEMSVWVRKA